MGPSINRVYGGERGGFLRQGSANGARMFEDKAVYFPNPANIGRNYDEDERKPVDGHNRRGQGIESFEEQMYEQRSAGYDRPPDRYSLDNRGYNSAIHPESRSDGYVQEEFGLIPMGIPVKPQPQDYQRSQAPLASALDVIPPLSPALHEHPSYYQSQPTRAGSHHGYQLHQDSAPSGRQNTGSVQQTTSAVLNPGSGVQNVWTARREGELSRSYSGDLAVNNLIGSGRSQAVASRIPQASAVEKVSSGRWNSRISPPTIEQPHDHGVYIQPLSRSYEAGRGLAIATEPASDIMQGRFPSDLGHALYSETIRNSSDKYIRSSSLETGRGVHPVSSRLTYSDVGQGCFSATRREQYGELAGKTLSDSSIDLAEGRPRHGESGRGSFSEPDHVRYAEDNSGHGHIDVGWRGFPGHRDSGRPAGTEAGTYFESGRLTALKEPGRFGGSEAANFVELGHLGQSNFGWMGVTSPGRAEYVEARVGMYGNPNRTASPDSGRDNFSNLDHRMDVETGPISYARIDTSGPYRHEGRQVVHSEVGHGPFGYEEPGQQSHGYISSKDYFSPEAPKSQYFSDMAKGISGNEKYKGTAASDLESGTPLERLQAPRGVRNLASGGSGVLTSTLSPAIPSDFDGKSISNERPKLKLLPRTKPLEVDSLNCTPQEGSGDVQGDAEGGQSGIAFSSDFPATVVPMSVNASAGSVPIENEEQANRLTERPRLNLKPRTQHADVVSEIGSTKERNSVFGGARPRELVLKERGVDESVIVGVDHAPSPGAPISGLRPASGGSRTPGGDPEHRIEKLDKFEEQKLDERYLEQHEGGNGRQMERQDSGWSEKSDSRGRKEGWLDQDRKEDRRRTERSEYWHLQDRRESDKPDVDKQDSWRRPVESPSLALGARFPTSPAGTGELSRGPGRIGASSAVELAQAFSRSTSFGSGGGGAVRGYPSPRLPMPRSPGPGFGLGYEASGPYGVSRNDAPFSRLTESPSAGSRDIYVPSVQNGYKRTNVY